MFPSENCPVLRFLTMFHDQTFNHKFAHLSDFLILRKERIMIPIRNSKSRSSIVKVLDVRRLVLDKTAKNETSKRNQFVLDLKFV